MKTIIFILCMWFALPLFGQSASPTIKDINWIHGVNTPNFWLGGEDYPNMFSVKFYDSTYLAIPNVVRAKGTNSIGLAAFATQVDTQATYSTSNFAIAHSMGGMVARRIDVDNMRNGAKDTKFKGIVTVGAPLNGAAAARSLSDGSFDNFLYNFIFKLTDPFSAPTGPLAAGALANAIVLYFDEVKKDEEKKLNGWQKAGIAVGTNIVLPVFLAPMLWTGAGTSSVYEMAKHMVRRILDQQFSGQTLKDLIPGNDQYDAGQTCQNSYQWVPSNNSSVGPWGWWFPFTIVAKQECNSTYANYGGYATPTPKVHFWGHEDQPIFMKTIESVSGGAAEALSNIRDVAYSSRGAFLDPIFAMKCGALGDYLGDGVNVDYARLLDAVHTEHRHRLTEIPSRLWNCFYQRQRTWSQDCGWFSWFCGWIEDFINVFVCAFKTIFIEVWVGYDVPVIDPSDGVVSASSQRGDGSQWRGTKIVELKGVGHNEMNGAKEMTQALTDLFQGDYGTVFKTTK